MKKGILITFEGTEGGGKSTQIKAASAYFRNKGRKVVLLREPGGTRISEAIREIILNKAHREMTQETELLLYLAARAQIVREKILPALKAGKVVICDRFEDSTLAYQGFGRGFDLAVIRKISSDLVRGSLKPAMTFVLDIDPRQGMKRGGRHDRMERQAMSFHQKVRKGFLTLAKSERRLKVIDASRTKEAVAAEILEILKREF